ncbi:MAG: transcription elongation protein SprT, partial [Haloarcula sp.]
MTDAGSYEGISSDADLIAWSREYCRAVRREQGVSVRFDLVDWEVSYRAKRRAAAVKRPKLGDATVGEQYDWDSIDGSDGRPLPCTVSLTWDAFAAFDRDAWEATLRHELIHVEQYQRDGTTDHGRAFRKRAD